MAIKEATLAALLLCAVACATDASSGAPTGDLSQSAADAFDQWCLQRDLSVVDIDNRATAAHLQVDEDQLIPMPNGQFFMQKNWLIPSHQVNAAPLLLESSDVTNGSLRVLGCGIYGPQLNGASMEAALSKLERLGAPTKHPQGLNGNTVWWSAKVGAREPSEDSEVMLSRDVPGMPGVSINLIYKIHLNNRLGR